MPNTYTQNDHHIVFAVHNRASLIHNPWKVELYKYITGIVQSYGHKMIIINGMPDHLHIVVGIKHTQLIPDLVMNIKRDSSKWINEKRFVNGKFQWQSGYGSFCCCYGHLPALDTLCEEPGITPFPNTLP